MKRLPTLKLDNNSIRNTNTLTYLGIKISRNLRWVEHLQWKRAVSAAKLVNLSKVATRRWGVSGKMLKFWYQTVFEKSILYGSAIWARNLTKAEKKILSAIQRPFLLKISRCYRTTPTDALQVLTGLPPLSLEAIKLCKQVSLLQLHQDIEIDGHTHTPSQYQHNASTLHMHPALKPYEGVHTSTIEQKPTVNTYTYYTDGSKTDNGVAAAIAIYHNNTETHSWTITLRPGNSVFQAEAAAIHQALLHIHQQENIEASIRSDSKSVLQAIQNAEDRNPQIQQLQRLAEGRLKQGTLSLNWIPAHTGIVGNERADSLAKKATKDHPNIDIPLPTSHLKKELKKEQLRAWQAQWEESTTGRFTHKYIPRVDSDRLSANPAANAFLTNHGPFIQYLKRFSLRAGTSSCICDQEGTAEHYLLHCPLTKKWHLRPPSTQNKTLWVDSLMYRKPIQNHLQGLLGFLLDNEENLQKAE